MIAPAAAPAAISPCIALCILDEAAGLCRGCGRTGEEIAAWPGLSDAERRAIMALLPARKSPAAPDVARYADV